MTDIPLNALGLQEKWPKLAELQDEVAGLERRQQEAVGEVQQLKAQLDPAREKDLNAEAEAIRSGKKAPEPVSEKRIQAKLEGAERTQRVLARALETARQDMAVLVGKHQRELFADVLRVRSEIAAKVAEAAREALAGFGRYEDLHYVLKGLQPPQHSADESSLARDTMTIIQAGTQRSGPDRGDVEGMLAYLVSLGASTEEDKDVAA